MDKSLKKLIQRNNVNDIDFESLVKQHGYVQARQMLRQKSISVQQEKIRLVEKDLNNANQPLRLQESLFLANTYGSKQIDDNVLERIRKGNQALLLSDINHLELLENVMKRRNQYSDLSITKPNNLPANINTSTNNNHNTTTSTFHDSNNIHESDNNIVHVVHSTSSMMEFPNYLPPSISNKGNNNKNNVNMLEQKDKLQSFMEDEILRNTLEGGNYCISIANQNVSELPVGIGKTIC